MNRNQAAYNPWVIYYYFDVVAIIEVRVFCCLFGRTNFTSYTFSVYVYFYSRRQRKLKFNEWIQTIFVPLIPWYRYCGSLHLGRTSNQTVYSFIFKQTSHEKYVLLLSDVYKVRLLLWSYLSKVKCITWSGSICLAICVIQGAWTVKCVPSNSVCVDLFHILVTWRNSRKKWQLMSWDR